MFSGKIEGGLALNRRIHALHVMFPEVLRQANETTAFDVVSTAKQHIRENDSIASGDLLRSIESKIAPDGLTVAVGSTSEHAPFVEFGTRPHWPPLDAIRRWCILKGIPVAAAYPIARKISEVGTPEQPFLYPAAKEAGARHLARVKIMLNAAVQVIVRGAK